MSTIQIRVDPTVCRLNGRCLERAPEIFRFGDDDAIEYDHEVSGEAVHAARDAEFLCPMQAIEVSDVAG